MTVRTLASRGRTAIASGVLAYAALQIGISLLIDVGPPALRDPEYGRKLTLLEAARAANPGRALVLALGSSRTAYAYQPSATAHLGQDDSDALGFNFGILGAGPLHERIVLDRLLAAGIRPRWLLLEVHPAHLHPTPVDGFALALDPYRCSARDVWQLAAYVGSPVRLWARWLVLRIGACYTYRAALAERFAAPWVTAPPPLDVYNLAQTKGDGWVPGPWRALSDDARRRTTQGTVEAYAAALDHFAVGNGQRRALADLVDECLRADIDVRLCLMPESARFRQAYPPEARRQIEALLAQLEQQCGAPVIDASQWGDDQWFVDGQHLLADGAREFSARFARDGLRPWLSADRDVPAASVARRRDAVVRPK
jgi:hypothetical protein